MQRGRRRKSDEKLMAVHILSDNWNYFPSFGIPEVEDGKNSKCLNYIPQLHFK